MEIIPAIDIRGGRCVQLVQGDYARETVFGDDPVAMARHWAALGATRIHVVDLDAAREGHPVNGAIIERILSQATAPIHVAGGIRDGDTIDRWAIPGVARIVIGTLAVEQPEAIERAVAKHGERIAVAVDARRGKAAVKGWVETSEMPVGDFVRDMVRRGVRHFIYTETDRDGMMEHPDYAEIKNVLQVFASTGAPVTVIYSGGVTSIEDLITLDTYNVEGAIVGTALYDRRIDLAEAKRALVTGDGT